MPIKESMNLLHLESGNYCINPKLASILNKAMKLEKTGQIIHLKKGLYVVSPSEHGRTVSRVGTGVISNGT
jgi:hypothetical protein